MHTVYCILLFTTAICTIHCKKFTNEEDKPAWAKKNIRDYNDADLERLLEQWEEDDEPLEQDELPEHLRPQPNIDFSKMDMTNPENLLKLTKKGRTLMVFVSVDGNPSREETEEITKLWQSSLWNNHIQAERYLVSDDRSIFLFKDGSQAWDAKEFLIEQERCKVVVIENKSYYGKHTEEYKEEADERKTKKDEL